MTITLKEARNTNSLLQFDPIIYRGVALIYFDDIYKKEINFFILALWNDKEGDSKNKIHYKKEAPVITYYNTTKKVALKEIELYIDERIREGEILEIDAPMFKDFDHFNLKQIRPIIISALQSNTINLSDQGSKSRIKNSIFNFGGKRTYSIENKIYEGYPICQLLNHIVTNDGINGTRRAILEGELQRSVQEGNIAIADNIIFQNGAYIPEGNIIIGE